MLMLVSSDFVDYSANAEQLGRRVSLLVKHTLGAGDQLIVTDIAVSSSLFRVVAVYAAKRSDGARLFFGSWGCF